MEMRFIVLIEMLYFSRIFFLKSNLMIIDQLTNSQRLEIVTNIINLFRFFFLFVKIFSVNVITCFEFIHSSQALREWKHIILCHLECAEQHCHKSRISIWMPLSKYPFCPIESIRTIAKYECDFLIFLKWSISSGFSPNRFILRMLRTFLLICDRNHRQIWDRIHNLMSLNFEIENENKRFKPQASSPVQKRRQIMKVKKIRCGKKSARRYEWTDRFGHRAIILGIKCYIKVINLVFIRRNKREKKVRFDFHPQRCDFHSIMNLIYGWATRILRWDTWLALTDMHFKNRKIDHFS